MANTPDPQANRFYPTQLELTGNRACLDFVNTVSKRKGRPEESLLIYADLLAWGVHASLLTPAEAKELSALTENYPASAVQVYQEVVALRETLYRLFQAVINDVGLDAAGTTALQRMYVQALSHASLRSSAGAFDWSWKESDLQTPLWRLVHDAVELLRTGNPKRLKACASPGTCASLFYDTSKNNSRRWCSMASCGVPEKVRQRHQRKPRS